jgi:mono/diheme cytochrome c family protein
MKCGLIAVLLLLGGHAALAADDPVPLKPGGDLTAAVCSACHTSDYIVMNSPFLAPATWKAEVTKMRNAFGAPIDDDTAAAITDYLIANYAAPKS